MEQTNRTILFERINPAKENILTFLSDTMVETLSDQSLQTINEQLQVSSFQECLDKFRPVLYLYIHSDTRQVRCSDHTIDAYAEGFNEVHTIELDRNNDLLNLFSEILNVEEDMHDNLFSPQAFMENVLPNVNQKDFKRERSALIRAYMEGELEYAEILFHQIIQRYDNGLMLLQIVLQEGAALLEADSRMSVFPVLLAEIQDNQMETLCTSETFYYEIPPMTKEAMEGYYQFLEKLLNGTEIRNKELMNHAFRSPFYEAQKREHPLLHTYNEYLHFYKLIIEKYWGLLKPQLETLLGIYAFFANYRTDKPLMPPVLLIANLSVDDLQTIQSMNKLEVYLRSVNEKTYFTDTIWYAILPGTEWKQPEVNHTIRERFHGNDRSDRVKGNKSESVRNLAAILAQYKIQSFISLISHKKTGSSYFISKGTKVWEEYQQEMLNQDAAEYMYPCFPNFTIIPDEHSEISIGKRAVVSEFGTMILDTKESVKLWLGTFGIEASYVAAGLYAACQCPGYLFTHLKRKVNLDLPGVAYPVTEDWNRTCTRPSMQLDVIRFPQDIISETIHKCSGVFFLSNYGKTSVASDYAMSHYWGQNASLSTVQRLTYIERILRFATQDFKSTQLEQFFERRPGSIMEQWLQNQTDWNSIIKKGERLKHHFDHEKMICNISVEFHDCIGERTIPMT